MSALFDQAGLNAATGDTATSLAEIMSAFTYALDLTEGQPAGHSLRACWIALNLAEALDLPPAERRTVYYATMLKDLGCSSNAARIAEIYLADDRAFKRDYKLIGAGLGCAYLTKSYAFLPATLLLVGLLIDGFGRKDGSRTRAVVGAVLAGGVFLLFSGPYITAISIQRGRLTIGESARLNYAFFIDQMDRWHEWHRQALGHALGNFKNAEDAIVDVPAVYSYARHLLGTYPLWFDPAYWTDGMQPQFWLSGHLQRLVRCSELLVRFLVDHPEALIYAATLFVTGHRFCNMGEVKKPFFAVTALGVAMLSIYFPVDIQDRYISVVFLLIVIPILSLIRPARVTPDLGAAAATILLAGLTMTNAARDVAQSRRVESGAGHAGGAYNGSIYTAAQSLAELGISPGSKLACMGDSACYVDQYWARLASSQIAAEIGVPNNEDPALFWQKLANKTNVLNALQDQNIKALVAIFPNGIASTEGWQRLGTGHFYVYLP